MRYQWDEQKARLNLLKHGVFFSDAVAVFADDRAVTIADERHDEERFISIGLDRIGVLLVVVYAWRGEDIRIISARKATGMERHIYRRNR